MLRYCESETSFLKAYDIRNSSYYPLIELIVGTVNVRRALSLDSNYELEIEVVFMLATKKMVQNLDRMRFQVPIVGINVLQLLLNVPIWWPRDNF